MKQFKLTLFLTAIISVWSISAFAISQTDENSATANIQPTVLKQVKLLIHDINERKQELDTLEKQLQFAKIESEINDIKEEIKKSELKIENHLESLEQIATGAVDLSLFDQATSEDFSWQAELKDIFKPLLYEMKRLTERPRQIEQLRSEKNTLVTQLNAANIAIEEIEQLLEAAQSKEVETTLTKLLNDWLEKQDDIHSQIQLVDFQLGEKLNNQESRGSAVVNAFKSFFTGRGLNLLLAILAFVFTYFSLRFISHSLSKAISKGRDKERRFFARLIHVVFQAFTILLSLLALLATLYAASDWLLLTLFIILLVGFVFALRNSLPRYLDEARLLLILGPVREGERVIYNGIPWRVSRLNIYSDLVNPLLTGGRIRLPMKDMLNLVSRRWSRNEPWFPCKADDFLVLDDDTYGRVSLQTPEFVQLKVIGDATLTYTVNDFISSKPTNISEDGFGLFVSFGLDYALQKDIPLSIPETLEAHLKQAFEESEYKDFIKDLIVEFDSAGASSLNLVMLCFFSGDAAEFYYPLKRFLQRTAVIACNEQGWNIPFNQLTVHMKPNKG